MASKRNGVRSVVRSCFYHNVYAAIHWADSSGNSNRIERNSSGFSHANLLGSARSDNHNIVLVDAGLAPSIS